MPEQKISEWAQGHPLVPGDESTKIYKSITLLWHVMRRARVGVGGGGRWEWGSEGVGEGGVER
jgi:hypothetical protein